MERVAGIEPAYSAWKAAALPLSYTRIIKAYSPINSIAHFFCAMVNREWWRELDSNQRTLSERIYSPSPLTTRTPLHSNKFNYLGAFYNLLVVQVLQTCAKHLLMRGFHTKWQNNCKPHFGNLTKITRILCFERFVMVDVTS
jgi:hypothetical protein